MSERNEETCLPGGGLAAASCLCMLFSLPPDAAAGSPAAASFSWLLGGWRPSSPASSAWSAPPWCPSPTPPPLTTAVTPLLLPLSSSIATPSVGAGWVRDGPSRLGVMIVVVVALGRAFPSTNH